MGTITRNPTEKSRLHNIPSLLMVRSNFEEVSGLRDLEIPKIGGRKLIESRKFILFGININGETKTALGAAKCGEEFVHIEIHKRVKLDLSKLIEVDPAKDKYELTVRGGGILYVDYDGKSINFGGISERFGIANAEEVKNLLIEGLKDKYKGYKIVHDGREIGGID